MADLVSDLGLETLDAAADVRVEVQSASIQQLDEERRENDRLPIGRTVSRERA